LIRSLVDAYEKIYFCVWINILIFLGWILKSTIFLWQVGKGLSLDAKAQKLAFQHWIEAVSMIVIVFNFSVTFYL
jgi:hypothetical protein